MDKLAHGKAGTDVAAALDAIQQKRDAELLADLRQQVSGNIKPYNPDNPSFRMLHLAYLESRFPDVYETATKWQRFPCRRRPDGAGQLCGFAACLPHRRCWPLRQGQPGICCRCQSGKQPRRPLSRRRHHRQTCQYSLTGKSLGLPASQVLSLEQLFNRVQPFLWAWVSMFAAIVVLGISLALQSRLLYILGLLVYICSLGFQVFGFFTRIVISGRPPVSDPYENLIWVAFMAGVFALVLELIYRRKVIALAGAMVATLGLVLADQLPLSPRSQDQASAPRAPQQFLVDRSRLDHRLQLWCRHSGMGTGQHHAAMITLGNPSRNLLKTLPSSPIELCRSPCCSWLRALSWVAGGRRIRGAVSGDGIPRRWHP